MEDPPEQKLFAFQEPKVQAAENRKNESDDSEVGFEEFQQIKELPEPCMDLVTNLDTYECPIPDSLTRSIMESCGLEADDPRVPRLLSLCAHKFMIDLLNDSLHHAKATQGGPGMRKQGKEKKYTLTPEDLESALRENGIHDVKPQYHA